MNHIFKVYDTDPFFMVDAATRAIKNMSQTKVAVIQGDHNSERFTFQLPRYIEGHDMMEADKVEVHFLNAGKDQTKGVYTVDDLSINDEDTTTVKCSWLLSKAATAHAGKLSFLVRFVCFAEDGVTVDYEWNTAIFSGISVGEGMDCSDSITDEAYIDIIEQWKTDLKAELNAWIDDEVASQVDLVQIQKNTQNIETLTEEHNLMKAKVDNFGKLNEGSTTADAELLDIRVDHEGNEFPSAGDAVREASRKAARSVAEIAEINARAIICKTEGKYPTVSDGASETNFKGLKIYGRTDQVKTTGANLFDVHSAEWSSSSNRASVEVLEDGTARVSVSKTADFISTTCNFAIMTNVSGNTVYLTMDVKGGIEGNQPAAMLRAINSQTGATTYLSASALKPTNGKISGTVTISESVRNTCDTLGLILYYNASSTPGWEVGSFVDFSNIMISTSDVPYEPYTGLAPSPSPEYPQAMNTIAEGGSVSVDVMTGNLIDINNVVNHINCKTETDGDRLIITKTNTTNVYSNLYFKIGKFKAFEGKKLTLSGVNLNDYSWACTWGTRTSSNTWVQGGLFGSISRNKSFKITFTPTAMEADDLHIRFVSSDNSVSDESYVLEKLQLRIDDITEYEPYNKKTAIFSTPNGLPGIPVTSGGNYTDESGQMWVADEVDVENGVYVQRIKEIVLTGEEPWKKSGVQSSTSGCTRYDMNSVGESTPSAKMASVLCSHYAFTEENPKNSIGVWAMAQDEFLALRFMTMHSTVEEFSTFVKEQYDNGRPIIVKYVLAEPIETPLTEEEIAAYKALKSHKPVTTIINDADAHIEADYVADTKTYIDNKFAELASAIVNNS